MIPDAICAPAGAEACLDPRRGEHEHRPQEDIRPGSKCHKPLFRLYRPGDQSLNTRRLEPATTPLQFRNSKFRVTTATGSAPRTFYRVKGMY